MSGVLFSCTSMLGRCFRLGNRREVITGWIGCVSLPADRLVNESERRLGGVYRRGSWPAARAWDLATPRRVQDSRSLWIVLGSTAARGQGAMQLGSPDTFALPPYWSCYRPYARSLKGGLSCHHR